MIIEHLREGRGRLIVGQVSLCLQLKSNCLLNQGSNPCLDTFFFKKLKNMTILIKL